MKKIFAKELAALAVLALAFTGCNTAFDGTNANFSEKESEYTDRSGASQSVTVSTVSASGSIAKNNNKNQITVTIRSFSKINLESADKAIHFQQLTNNSTTGYYPTRGADLPKTRISANEGAWDTTNNWVETKIYYEVNGTGVTTNKVAFFVDAKELKTKGGTAVLALDGNLTRGEVSDSYIQYLTADGTTAINGNEIFAPTYNPIGTISTSKATPLTDSNSKETGVLRVYVNAANKNADHPTLAAEYESGLADKLNNSILFQYREPGKREYTEKKLTFTYHESASTVATDPYNAHQYTADIQPMAIGTQWRIISVKPEGITAPAWYTEAVGHPAIVYGTNRAGARHLEDSGSYTLHATVPTYIAQTANITTGPDASSSYNPTSYAKSTIVSAQDTLLAVSSEDNWFKVTSDVTGVKLSPTACSDFIVVDSNNKKIASEVQVITYSYNDSTTISGDVEYVKILVKDARYRNSLTGLSVAVGKGTKIVENKVYPAQVTFGVWEDVADDDLSGYCKIH